MSAAEILLPSLPVVPAPAPVPVRPSQWLFVVSHTDPRYGGLSSAVPALAASLDVSRARSVRMAAFCAPGEEYVPGALGADKVSFWPTSRKAWATDRALKASFAAALHASDAVHVHGLWEESTAVACRLARRLDKPYVLSAHGMLEPWALAAKRLKKQIYAALIERANVNGAACLHALTRAEAQQYRDFGAQGPVAVVPNAVELPTERDPELFVRQYPELRGKRIVLFLSRLHPKKGLDLLLASWGEIAREHPEARLVIAGPDSEGMQAGLQAEAAQRGIAEQVCFTGMLTGALKWSALINAEAYVLPSYSEGLSMALLEAMGMGVPVIATRACNMPEITENKTGWEIDATAESLSGALRELLEGSEEKNWVKGRNGARLVAARYTPAQVTRQMAEVYDFVLGGVRPAHVDLGAGGAR